MLFRLIACKPLLSGHFSKFGISLYEIFSLQCEKSFKNPFSNKFSYLYLQTKDKKILCFFSISFVCMFITLFYVPILFNMSIGRFPALQECPRRLFWCFLRCEKNQNDCFYDSRAARRTKMTVFMIPASQECSRRPF